MFIVVSDLNEAQRERDSQVPFLFGEWMSPLTLLNLWTCSIRRVSGHVSSMNRIFIVEVYGEDDFGQWAQK